MMVSQRMTLNEKRMSRFVKETPRPVRLFRNSQFFPSVSHLSEYQHPDEPLSPCFGLFPPAQHGMVLAIPGRGPNHRQRAF
jgi:hypothetical protein